MEPEERFPGTSIVFLKLPQRLGDSFINYKITYSSSNFPVISHDLFSSDLLNDKCDHSIRWRS